MEDAAYRVIALTEYEQVSLPPTALTAALGQRLWQDYGRQVVVEPPSFQTAGQWRLTAQGWVGVIPLTSERRLVLQPKVPLRNLLRMLEYAYQLQSFRLLEELVETQSWPGFYERLALALAGRVLQRARQGFYRGYLIRQEALPAMRGRLDGGQLARRPWAVELPCRYQEQTVDLLDNHILAWTLWRIAHSGLLSERGLPVIRQACQSLRGLVTLTPVTAQACAGRLYHRLNEDYRPLHALCRLFLEHTGPDTQVGDHLALPFLVNMERLFELFVAEWLSSHLPAAWRLQSQERVQLDAAGHTHFVIDLVVYEKETNAARWVLDTKYKTPAAPAAEDIAQVVAYAEAKGCREAVLVYPTALARPLDTWVGRVRVRSLAFSLAGDLEAAGQGFWQELSA
ncbi:MAG: restriction endonuclease [Chloroflexota bacterium]